LATLGKKGLWQSQDNIYLKEFCPEKVALGNCWN